MWPVFPRYVDPLRHWRALSPERVALVDRGRGTRQTYAEMDASADAWAAVLGRCGAGKGDRDNFRSQNGHKTEEAGQLTYLKFFIL